MPICIRTGPTRQDCHAWHTKRPDATRLPSMAHEEARCDKIAKYGIRRCPTLEDCKAYEEARCEKIARHTKSPDTRRLSWHTKGLNARRLSGIRRGLRREDCHGTRSGLTQEDCHGTRRGSTREDCQAYEEALGEKIAWHTRSPATRRLSWHTKRPDTKRLPCHTKIRNARRLPSIRRGSMREDWQAYEEARREKITRHTKIPGALNLSSAGWVCKLGILIYQNALDIIINNK